MSHYISHARMNRVDQHFQATNASLCGDLTIAAARPVSGLGSRPAEMWLRSLLRRRTNVQELACLHVDTGVPLVIGEDVTIGHGAVVHCKSVGDGTLIGMKAVVLGGAVIGKAVLGGGRLCGQPEYCGAGRNADHRCAGESASSVSKSQSLSL